MQLETAVSHSCLCACSLFFKKKQKAAIIIAILDQKILHWKLSKVISSGKSNHNFEAIN